MNEVYTFVAVVAAAFCLSFVWSRYRREYIVTEGLVGLLYHEGHIAAALPAGRYVRWGRNFALVLVESRKTLLQVAGQEVLTADNVAVKLSVVLTIQVVDAIVNKQIADSAETHLYSAAQTFIRELVSAVTLEVLISKRNEIGGQLLDTLAEKGEALGIRVHAAEVRDVMLPGDLRKAFSEVLKAKQEGHAALERARGESAALRNLANAARLMENQPALATLRFLQTLENSGDRQMVVMNDISSFLASLGKRKRGQAIADEGE